MQSYLLRRSADQGADFVRPRLRRCKHHHHHPTFFSPSCNTTPQGGTVVVVRARLDTSIVVALSSAYESWYRYWKSGKACAKRGLAGFFVRRVYEDTDARSRGRTAQRFLQTYNLDKTILLATAELPGKLAIRQKTGCAFL